MPNKETKTIIGIPSDFKEVAHGTTNGKSWKIYNGFVNGEKFSTFDDAYVDCPKEEKIFFYEEEQKGKFLNKTLKHYSDAKDPTEDPFEEAKDEIPVIEETEEEKEEAKEEKREQEQKEEMKSLKGDGTIFEKIHHVLLEILTVLERE